MDTAFQWSPVFETGFTHIDGQHRALIDLINNAAMVVASPESASIRLLEGLQDELIEYTRLHFADEEALMVERRLDKAFISNHIRQHRDFEREITAVRENSTGERREAIALLQFLTSWLSFHILSADRLMAEQIRLVEDGVEAREAHRQVLKQQDAAALQPLLDALTSLYYIITSRNQALTDMNRSLESMVTARTAELGRDKDELASLVKKMELTQSQLLQSEKMASIGQLAAGVAHEINNPVGFVNSNLGTLKGYVEDLLEVIDTYAGLESLLPQDPALQQRLADMKKRTDLAYLREDVLELLKESQDGLGRIKRIVADLKDFSHAGEADWQHADLNSGLESTLNVVWNELKYKTEVIRDFCPLPPVRCVAAQLNQVFMNLLVNAAHAIETKGTITISTRTDGDDVVVTVADTGKGIPPDIQQRIFEPFFTTKPVGKGTGLGLSIAWDIIRKHHGTLSVASKVGEGTAFSVRVPVAGPPDEVAVSETAS
ncbi:MAG TPA: ATP-binding protein [Aromatoleum sp.]|uniref:ATP-binding protein n=1 Tax=Aromatoleum sp. TaxID=2307007 RepID=UPI002B4853D5|nr:ATP-binding protein [Aromatoleum sp.]HJV25580.1 ATP-binding protein [Aromatoleum sp.]